MFAIVGLFDGTWGRGKEKRMIENSIRIHCISKGRRHNKVPWKR
jgi:hypothetical protein